MYKAIVTKLTHIREHPNADRLKLAIVSGHQICIGLDHQEGELGVFFPTDGLLSDEFCLANDLYPRYDEEGNRIGGGFFDQNRPRVRAQNFRGAKSEGYWCGLESLSFTGYDISKLSEGDTFDELNGIKICEKYYTPATLRAMKQGKARRANSYFAKHVDTEQFRYGLATIPVGSIIYITEKLHGTSFRMGRVLEEVPVQQGRFKTWLLALAQKAPQPTKEYRYLHGTRNVILADRNAVGYYEDEAFRWQHFDKLEGWLHPGECVYGEIVGWVNEDSPIMPDHDVGKMRDIKAEYGNKISYKYGCPAGTSQLYVYRITKVDEEGNVVDLPWPQVNARSIQLGLPGLPYMEHDISGPVYEPIVYDGDAQKLQDLVASFLEGPSALDLSHIGEGVVLRIETPDGRTYFLKEKSYTFKVLEGIIKDKEDYVDLEEIS